ncbi:MAG: SAM-dependent methyltransferase [Gammaproteobacteria bacterium]|nr:MAG: SAM-dependent methyltransferase [Gammaproteobacteria bacterium]
MNITLANLPAPDAESLEVSRRLVELIRSEIAGCGGQISFARYMELALYAPGLGYYSAGARKFGASGDFVTAPEISPLFARCVARQCAQVLRELGGGDMLEAGAGSGALACDALQELERMDCLPRHYFILELSAELRARQRALIEQRVPHLAPRVQWLDALPPAGFRGVMFANELLDAMPVHRFRIEESGASELYVTWQDTGFAWRAAKPGSAELEQRIAALDLAPGFAGEISLSARAWIKSVAELLEAGLILLVDYGFPRRELYHPQRSQGTLLCHYRHRAHGDPFLYPGLQDITAHVDFTAVAGAAHEAGMRVAGYATQANFLLSCGLAEMAADTVDTRTRVLAAQQVRRLTLPDEMGEVFKAIALTRGLDAPLLGFAFKDDRARLSSRLLP